MPYIGSNSETFANFFDTPRIILIGMGLRRLFTDHPATVGESYTEHLATASGFGIRMILGGLACLIHGVVPFAFVCTGSRTITELHARMVTHRRRSSAPSGVPAQAD